MTAADILTAILIISLVVAPTWLLLRATARPVARKRARLIWPPGWRDKDRNEPETYGDDGGRPTWRERIEGAD